MVNRKLTIFLLVFCVGAIFVTTASASTISTTTLTVSYIDVGQGDSIWIHDSNGFDILIDGGKPSAGPTVLAYLRSHGIDDIEVMIASHPDSDHIGGLIDVLEATDIPVQQVFYSGYPGNTVTWGDFTTAVANEGIALSVAQYPGEYTWGSTTAYILNPVSGLSNPATNDASVVTLLGHGNIKFMFPGDISSTVEAAVVARETPVPAQILKIAHHGSAYSSSGSFLSAVSPLEAIISVGDNSYGHPSADTISRLLTAGARVWRTDQMGTIVVVSNGTTYTITSSTGNKVYLPLVIKSGPSVSTQTPTSTATSATSPTLHSTPTQTQIQTATQTPTPTQTATSAPASSGNVVISTIFYDGAGSQEPDEFVEIRNDDTQAIQLQSWTLRDIGNHMYTFPSFLMQPGQVCRVYTNQSHPESCSFNYGSGAAIWNNTGDCAYLRDSLSTLIDDYCY